MKKEVFTKECKRKYSSRTKTSIEE